MWKRDEAVKPPTPPTLAGPATAAVPAAPAVSSTGFEPRTAGARDVVHIGKSVVIKGELSASEDLTLYGQMEGSVTLPNHTLTIGPHAEIKAAIAAKRAQLVKGTFYEFQGPLYDQAGKLRVPKGKRMTLPQILTMDWLVKGIEGSPKG